MRIILFFLFLVSQLSADKTCEQITEYIFKHLPEYGTLKQDRLGFVYVDIDDRYINDLNSFIEEEGFEKPPYFGPGLHGAHISVIYAREADQYKIGEIEETEAAIYFKIKNCKTIAASNETYYILTVEAPNLNKLRKKYGLPKSYYDFHITIGKKVTEAEPASVATD